MKKILRNAALVGASLIALNAAAEGAAGQGPVLSFGGSITAGAVGVNQKVRLAGNAPAVSFISKGNLVMNVGGTSNNNMGYGAVGILNFDRAKTLQDRIEEAYIYMNHDCIGNVKIGDTEGVVQTMMYTGDDVLGGLGGTSGDLEKFINVTRTVSMRPSIAPANNKATKLVWISPEVHGFQVGLDFTPSTNLHGRVARNSDLDSGTNAKNASLKPYSKNLVAGGLSYNKAFSKFNLGLYLVGHSGKSRNDNTGGVGLLPSGQKFKDTKGYQVGALFDYQNWQVAASWFDNKDSLVRTTTAANTTLSGHTNTKGVNAAIGYDFARNANVAVGYTHTYRKVTGGDAKADVAMLTLDYVVAPGWVAFAEIDHFRLKAPAGAVAAGTTSPISTGLDIYADRDNNTTSNHGTAFILGTKLRF
jgi:hypothetical protein